MSLRINLGLQIDGCYRRSVPNETGLCANKVYSFKAPVQCSSNSIICFTRSIKITFHVCQKVQAVFKSLLILFARTKLCLPVHLS